MISTNRFQLTGLILGYDFFISYSHKDGSEYARSLAGKLKDRGFSCFIDNQELHAGQDLDNTILSALKRSRMLILIGTSGAAESAYVKKEIEAFSKNHKIIPINIAGMLDHSPDNEIWNSIRRLIWIKESDRALESGEASSFAVDEIGKKFNATRRNIVKRRLLIATAAVLIFLSLGMASLGYVAIRQAGEQEAALNARDEALKKGEEALEREKTAQAQRDQEIKRRADETGQKERALNGERMALEQARQNEILAERNEIDKELAEDSLLPHSPIDWSRYQRLNSLLRRSTKVNYVKVSGTILERLARLTRPEWRQEILPEDRNRLAAMVSSSGERLCVAYTDRLEIFDSRTLELLYTHKMGDGQPVRDIWIKPDLHDERIVYEIKYDSPGTHVFSLQLDGTPPVVISDNLRVFANFENYKDSQLGRTVTWLLSQPGWEHVLEKYLERMSNLRRKLALTDDSIIIPLVYSTDRKINIYKIYLPVAEQKDPKSLKDVVLASLPSPRSSFSYLVLCDEEENVVKLTEESEQMRFVTAADRKHVVSKLGAPQNILLQHPDFKESSDQSPDSEYVFGHYSDRAIWNLEKRILLAGNKLLYFTRDGRVSERTIKIEHRGVVGSELDAEAKNIILYFKDGSIGLYNLANETLLHRFPKDKNTRALWVTPKGDQVLRLLTDGRLERWKFSAFGPDGWPEPAPSQSSSQIASNDQDAGLKN